MELWSIRVPESVEGVVRDGWTIHLLGGLSVECGSRIVERFPTRKSASLLAYLAYHPDRPAPREVLAEMLWPGGDPESGRKSLSVALSTLRRLLEADGCSGSSPFVADRFGVQLDNSAVTTDVSQFEEAHERGLRAPADEDRAATLREAVELYAGPLLPGFYEEWVTSEQVRLAGRFYDALVELTGALGRLGDVSGAVESARKAIALDPLREDAHAALIRVYAEAGRSADALRQYQELEQALRRELAATPSPQTRSLVGGLRSAGARPGDGVRTASRSAAESIYVSASSLPEPSALAPTVAGRPIHVPVALTEFFGRQAEIAAIAGALVGGRDRLLTLTGPGGCGKTRLALEAAARLQVDAYPASVWFVPLADIADPSLIAERILAALGLPLLPDADLLGQAAAALSRQPSLLVLDNVEQLVGVDGADAAAVVRRLLEDAPALACLVTSRRRLGLAGEREVPVAPLPTPRAATGIDEILECPSAQLLADRIRSVRPDFVANADNALAIAALCTRLEGIPLAIELAAARGSVLTPAQMLDELSNRLGFLVSRQRDVEPRHRTLRAAIDWSYRLLPPASQRLFARLSVFRGGWTLEAAQVICSLEGSGSGTGPGSTLAALEHLRECSLITAQEAGDAMRFGMLEVLREYAAERLGEGETAELQRRHLEWCVALAEAADVGLQGADQILWLERLERESGNLRLALDLNGPGTTGAPRALRLAGRLVRFWGTRGHFAEGLSVLERALQGEGSPGDRAEALNAAWEMAYYSGEMGRAAEHAEEALGLAGRLAHVRAVGRALMGLSLTSYSRGEDARARSLARDSAERLRGAGDLSGAAMALNNLGDMAGDPAEGTAIQEECLALFRSLGDRHGMAFALDSLGRLASARGEMATAYSLTHEALRLFREIRSEWAEAISLGRVADIAAARGDQAHARELYLESLAIFQRAGSRWGVASALHRLGDLEASVGDVQRADELLQRSLAQFEQLEEPMAPPYLWASLAEVARQKGDTAAARSLLHDSLAALRKSDSLPGEAYMLRLMGRVARSDGDPEEAAAWFREGLHAHRGRPNLRVAVACLEGLAGAWSATGQLEPAARLFGAAEAARESIDCPMRPVDRRAYADDARVIRDALGPAACEAAWREGRRLSPDAAVELALRSDAGAPRTPDREPAGTDAR